MAEAANRQEFEAGGRRKEPVSSPDLADYPVREYVAAMAAELATMARWDGDERLASALEMAVDLAKLEAPSL